MAKKGHSHRRNRWGSRGVHLDPESRFLAEQKLTRALERTGWTWKAIRDLTASGGEGAVLDTQGDVERRG
jgi:hypothetical protein